MEKEVEELLEELIEKTTYYDGPFYPSHFANEETFRTFLLDNTYIIDEEYINNLFKKFQQIEDDDQFIDNILLLLSQHNVEAYKHSLFEEI